MTATAMRGETAPTATAGRVGVASWMLFDWASQPFYTLITTFLFAPYFTAHFIADAAWGPAIWGYTMAAAAVLVALGSPLLGALADARGRLKPMIFWLSIIFVLAQALLWYAVPGAPSSSLWIVLAGLLVATVAAEFATVLNNSLMPRIVPADQLGRVSGGGWALGYVGGLISLLFMAGLVLTDTRTGLTLLGLQPILTLDAAAHEAERLIGPFCAAWYVLFVIPFFLFTPDAPPTLNAGPVTLSAATASVLETLAHIRRYRDIVLFFLARMLFIDGLLAIFSFGGIYAAEVFGWQAVVVGYFGIILSIAAGIGAAIGGFLDDRLGSKRVIIGSLVLLVAGALGVISIDKTHVLFALEVEPKSKAGAAFASVGEQVYLAFAVLIGIASGPLQSASRSLLARMAPAERMSEFFGFFAFSGKVTAFAAPLIIATLSAVTGSLQIAMSAILVFLFTGLVLMAFVNTERRAV